MASSNNDKETTIDYDLNKSADSSPPVNGEASESSAAASTPSQQVTIPSESSIATHQQQQQQARPQQRNNDMTVALYYHCMEALTKAVGFDESTAQDALDQVLQQQKKNHKRITPDEIVTLAYNYILDHDLAQDQGGPVVPLFSCPHGNETFVKITPQELHSVLQLPFESNICNHPQNAKNETTLQQPDHEHHHDNHHRTGLAKPVYEENGNCPAGENWLCLSCGALRCSRYVNGHALEHWHETSSSSSYSHTIDTQNSNAMQEDNEDFKSNSKQINITPAPASSALIGHAMAVSLADLSVWCYACQAYLRPDHNALLQPLVQQLQDLKFGATAFPETKHNDDDDHHDDPATRSTIAMNVDHGNDDPDDEHHGDDDHHNEEVYEYDVMEESTHHRRRSQRASHIMIEEAYNSIASLDISSKHEVDDDHLLIDYRQESMSCEDADDADEVDDDNEDEEGDLYVDGGGSRGFPLDISGHAYLSDQDDDYDDDDDDDEDDGVDHQTSSSNDDNDSSRRLRQESQHHLPFPKPPKTLQELAQFILSDRCRSIVILAGAGMSVASGIPDFRSSHNGLYATIDPDILSCTNSQQRQAIRLDPTVAFDKDMFLENPLPCLELLRTFILNTHAQVWKATLAHRFVELLAHKTNKLVRLYTQNIDGLEGQCTLLSREKVCHVHGTMDRAECARCDSFMDMAQFCQLVRRNIKDIFESDNDSGHDAATTTTTTTPNKTAAPVESSPIVCPTCGYASVKPAIVLFRANLPMEFFELLPQDIAQVDLLLILGTSLMVSPANSLVWRVPSSTIRVVINQHKVGHKLGIIYEPCHHHGDSDDDDDDEAEDQHKQPRISRRDFFAQGDCEEVVLELMTYLGWLNELQPLLDQGSLPQKSAQLLSDKLTQRT